MRFILLFGVSLAALTAVAQDKPASFPSNEQMRHYRAMSEPQLSPDGKQVLLRVSESTADGANSHLWLIDVGGGAPRQLTYSPDSDKRGERSGAWMPDGQSILFLAKRGEHVALYRLPMNGGEAKALDLKITPLVDQSKREDALPPRMVDAKDDKQEPLPIDVGTFRVSPDGKTIALIAQDPETPGEKKQKDAKADAEWADHDLHGSRLYLVDVASGKLTLAGVPIDVRGAAWSADSSKLIVEREEPNGASELGPAMSAWLVTMQDAAHGSKIDEIPATVEAASWSTDGSLLYFLAQAKRDTPPGYPDLYVDAVATKRVTNLTDGFSGSLSRMQPLALRDAGVLVSAERGFEESVISYRVDGRAEPLKLPLAVVGGAVTNVSQSGWIFEGSSGGVPTQLLYEAKLGDAPKVLQTPPLAPEGVRTAAPKRLSWKSDSLTIEGMLYLPPNTEGKRIPLIVEVHGGPLGAYLDSYSVFTDFLLGHGWSVLRMNPRGSTGRGAEFAAANKNDLGGGDYRDIMAGVDYVLKNESVDPDRLALMGYSYGGEMAAFVETKTTRFKAIVSAAPVIDQNSEYGTERGSFYDQWYFGKPWEHQTDAWRQSPLSGAAQAKTPFMLLQGESDSTDPLGQSQEMYRALRQMKVPVELITYPRDDHGPLSGAIYGSPSPEPWHGFDARQRVVAFFEKAFGATK